jgi:hypothetical protein
VSGPLWLVYRKGSVFYWRVFGEGVERKGTAPSREEAKAAALAALEALA